MLDLTYLKKHWWIFVLIFIFLFSYYIRAINILPERILSFDPVFQYRYTKYFVDWGHMPIWDELTYYVGRKVDFSLTQPLMYYITGILYLLFKEILKMSLVTFASYISAVYGALIIIPAFLLGRELSNNYGGLLSAALMGTAPQVLIRTFGSSYDTDQIVLFFILLTLYTGFYAMRKKTIPSFCLFLGSLAAFMLTWNNFMYTFLMLSVFVVIYFLLNVALDAKVKKSFNENIKGNLAVIKPYILVLVLGFILLFIIGTVNNTNIISIFLTIVGFAQKAERWIVNVSIAELQPFNILSFEGLILSFGRFVSGDNIIDITFLIFFLSMIAFGIFRSFKTRRDIAAFFVMVLVISVYTSSRGIRFTEFTSSFFIILVGAGFGLTMNWAKNDSMKKALVVGFSVFIVLNAMNISLATGKQLGPDINANWEDAWTFLKTQTPEFSIVGTWWDPGHMITGSAERRAYADGAHCGNGADGQPACLYTINDRITDLGKIMATTDENVSMNLIRKYQGNSPKVYWIASDDLIGKFQWLQFFGMGCDARVDRSCPLYIQVAQQSQSTDQSGNVVLRDYGSIKIFEGLGVPIPLYINPQDINGGIFDEVIFYNQGNVTAVKFNETDKQALMQTLKPLETQLNFRFSNQSIPLSVWVPAHYAYIVAIPENLRDSVFTKMFMLEGEGLEHFKQVFRNEQVKIYEVI